jgi:hypothetical protein
VSDSFFIIARKTRTLEESLQQESKPNRTTAVSPSSGADACHDQYAELKCSASVRQLSRWLGLSLEATSDVCRYFNFFLLVALITWKAKPILTAMAQERYMSIKQTIEEAQQLGDEARAKWQKLKSGGLSLIMKLRQSRPAQKPKRSKRNS